LANNLIGKKSTGFRNVFCVLLALLCSHALAAAAGKGMGYDEVVRLAKESASQPYKAPPQVPRFLRELSYNDYQNIRFNPDKSLWQDNKSNFQVMLVPPGLYYTHTVKINVVDSKGVHLLPFQEELFNFDDPELAKRMPRDLGYAGFKLTYPLEQASVQNQFLVFAGASYFRGVARDNAWGISARGVAIDTGLPTGEEFPSFVEFWLVKPAADAESVVVYGLLDGPSLAGAYQFTVSPGNKLQVKVKAMLFPRKNIQLLGAAPLTSMFFYGENTPRPRGEWRAQVHDSDGLLIQNGITNEWLWRPLINPKNLEMDYFATENVHGFGLLQRDDLFTDYQDLAAHYHARPSTWVEPQGNWGKGTVVLVQLPTTLETNDNIVAFWTPEKAITAQEPIALSYNLGFGNSRLVNEPMGQAINTFLGDGNIIGGGHAEGAYRVIVDFAGGVLDKVPGEALVNGVVSAQEEGEVLEQYVEYNAPLKAWRLSILARPAKNKPLVLRAFLSQKAQGSQAPQEEKTLTETWTYRLPVDNDILSTR
jgi:glucans biosynthesis protein